MDSDAAVNPAGERVFHGVITVAALFVALLGYLDPATMDRAFTWAELPPLHARFVGTLYLFGAVFLAVATFARRARPVRPAMGGIAVFTGVLLLVTLRNPQAFDYALVPVWVWTASYVVYPVVAVAFLLARRGRPVPPADGPAVPGWVRGVLVAHAVVFGVVGVLMFVVPDAVVGAWPWPVTSGVVQAYSSPFLTVAFCAGAYAHRSTWPEVWPVLPALFVLHTGTLAVTGLHREVLGDGVATVVWVGAFTVGAVVLAAALVATVVDAAGPVRQPARARTRRHR
jgi:hypothetical protein